MPSSTRRKCESCGKYLAVKGSTRCRWHGGGQTQFRDPTALEDVETPTDGIRATYEVTFTPAEAARVRAAAREAGTTVTRYLRDLAAQVSARTEVVVHIEGATLDKARLRSLVEAEMLRLGGRGPQRR